MIYQLYIIKNTYDSDQFMFNLPEEQQKQLREQHEQVAKESGSQSILTAYSAWANEETLGWGVEAFADAAARIKHTLGLERIGWLKHVKAFTLLGTPVGERQTPNFPNPIYKLWMARNDSAAAMNFSHLTEAEKRAFWDQDHRKLDEVGGCYLFWCKSWWCSEEFTSWGVNAYPSIEAAQAHGEGLEAMNIARYQPGIALLGTILPEG